MAESGTFFDTLCLFFFVFLWLLLPHIWRITGNKISVLRSRAANQEDVLRLLFEWDLPVSTCRQDDEDREGGAEAARRGGGEVNRKARHR